MDDAREGIEAAVGARTSGKRVAGLRDLGDRVGNRVRARGDLQPRRHDLPRPTVAEREGVLRELLILIALPWLRL